MPNNIVAVMVKYPEQSKVKTRLAKTIGDAKALIVYKLLLDNLIEICLPDSSNNYQLGAFVTPAEQTLNFKKLYNNYSFYNSQSDGNLGQKMSDALKAMKESNQADKVILIGADIPNLNREIIADAFEKLNNNDIVIGPTDDGGYYLIGMKKLHPELFVDIAWGTSSVLKQSLEICQKHTYTSYLLPTLSDLDIEEDLKQYPNILEKLQ